eukprot:scaffold3000_cov98-Skeletonema_marinoi.AAC.2
MIHLGCLWFADLCWPAKKGGTAIYVSVLSDRTTRAMRCAARFVRKGFGDSGPQCGSTSPYDFPDEVDFLQQEAGVGRAGARRPTKSQSDTDYPQTR